MTVGVLLITHEGVGDIILRSATRVLEACPLQTDTLGVSFDCNPEQILQRAERVVEQLDTGDGVLILTDMCGSTPSNIAHRLSRNGQVQVITGLNLPMMMRVMNYATLSLPDLAAKAVSGGRDGVMRLEPER